MTEQRKRTLKRKLQESRQFLLKNNEDFCFPLKEMIFVATKDVYHMSTNGFCIYFDPDWLYKLRGKELDFMLCHQLMHIKLNHIDRSRFYTGDRFHLACDIVANAKLACNDSKLPHIGKIYKETFFPIESGFSLTPEEAILNIPFDPATLSPGKRNTYMIDSERWWDEKEDRGQQGIIVLSPDDEDPDDLEREESESCFSFNYCREKTKRHLATGEASSFEQSSLTVADSNVSSEAVVADELKTLREKKKSDSKMGTSDTFRERLWQVNTQPSLNWKRLLNTFIQEELCDYSFTPPDRRLQDTEFFLPDFNVTEEKNNNILFMVDTSGSIDSNMLSAVYTELYGALSQFNGQLTGLLGFFDTKVYQPVSFNSTDDLSSIMPLGGGGTNYHCIFNYVSSNMPIPPSSIVIFTDGEGFFPEETVVRNIPVLWILSSDKKQVPWGRCAVFSY